MSDLSNDTKKHTTKSRETISLNCYEKKNSKSPRYFISNLPELPMSSCVTGSLLAKEEKGRGSAPLRDIVCDLDQKS
jgi:hypothetical protein